MFTHVVDLSTAGVNSLEQLIHLIVAHLLAKIRQDVSELTDTDETSHLLVKDLEAAAVLFWLAWVAETARSVQDLLEGVKVDCPIVSVPL